jgi:adenylosuccinate synthase
MSLRIVAGINWGDEGKGKMVDYLASQADVVIRYQGGNNAGHTIDNEFGNFKLHLIPSGIFYRNVVNLMGPGAVVNLEAAVKEMNDLRAHGIHIDANNYKISDRAVIVFPFHQLQDGYEEARLGADSFGSTKMGIGPIYADRHMKYSIQVGALNYPDYLKQQLIRCLDLKNRIFAGVYHKPPFNLEAAYSWALQWGEILKPHICDSIQLLKEAQKSGARILMEGQLGALRDVIYGIYPFSTSSNTIAGFGPVGSGYFGQEKAVVTGIMKAFSTCVGEGPFVTEIKGEFADKLREVAFEYGASTGRPRRIGHFDAVASRYGVDVNGATELALTKLDNLSGLGPLKICTQYKVGDKLLDSFPIMAELIKAEAIYIEMPGWEEDISAIREYAKLPLNARHYIEKIEELVGCRIAYISVGANRQALIVR